MTLVGRAAVRVLCRVFDRGLEASRRCLAIEAVLERIARETRERLVAEALPLWEEIWPGPAMKLAGPLAARSPGLRLALTHEIERHCCADEILQGPLIHLVAFVDVDGAPDLPFEAGIE